MPKKVTGVKSFDEYDFLSSAEVTWRLKAACRNKETSLFFSPPKSNDVQAAKKICRSCPVSAECLYSGLTYQYQGIWGGTTEEERVYVVKHICKNDISNLTMQQCEKMSKMF